MEPRDRYTAAREKRRAVNEAEARGQIADSMEVRLAIMARVHSGEITLAQGQEELKKIKRSAKKSGMLTRQQAFSRG